MKFSHEFIEQVRQANDIVSVISDYAGLKRRGSFFGKGGLSILSYSYSCRIYSYYLLSF